MLANWVKETTTTTGAGTLTLSAITGFPRFSEAFAADELVSYAILTNDTPPRPLEWGIGTMGASNTLARTTVLGTYAASTLNTTNPTAVNLSAGTYNVICAESMGGVVPGLPGIDTTNGSGGSFVPYPWAAGSAALVLVADRMYISNFRLSSRRKVTAFRMRVSTAVAGNLRMGIYKCGVDGKPAELMLESGDISTGSTGVITWTLATAKIFPPGWYFFAIATKGTAPTVNSCALPANHLQAETPVGTDATAVVAITYKYAALSSGWTDLPDPATSSQTHVSTAPPAFSIVTG